ncbi:hypothetical protein FB567DRAFT_259908 [Paraphoma chrysanthemicola]|uniref:Uncharacterized protein n=1 Tax=Paraphoma chrysanthemicola TaxID=798071 RepID=A0A8K0QTC8_9PLEO|nr:hypothetical protein FB567DRAFT_259908 [Paraphoma chrysanthemicola]
MTTVHSAGDESPDKREVDKMASLSQGACCSNCKELLDLPDRRKRPFWRTFGQLIDFANECIMCAIFLDGLNSDFEFDIDLLSEYHLDGSEVSFDSYNDVRATKKITSIYEMGSTVQSFLVKRHVFTFPRILGVLLRIVWKGRHFPAFDRAYWNHAYPIGLLARIPTVSDWMDKCRSSHSKCQCDVDTASRKIKSARVIKISEHEREIRIRLIKRAQVKNRNARYVVLSHCWGGKIPHCRTIRDNLTQHYESIDFHSFPQTFKEAVLLTKLLGMNYL